jgi:hypothetical protein
VRHARAADKRASLVVHRPSGIWFIKAMMTWCYHFSTTSARIDGRMRLTSPLLGTFAAIAVLLSFARCRMARDVDITLCLSGGCTMVVSSGTWWYSASCSTSVARTPQENV